MNESFRRYELFAFFMRFENQSKNLSECAERTVPVFMGLCKQNIEISDKANTILASPITVLNHPFPRIIKIAALNRKHQKNHILKKTIHGRVLILTY